MDKMKEYSQLIENLFLEQRDLLYAPPAGSDVETHAIFDRERQRFMIYRSGWQAMQRVNSPVLYVRLFAGKIWVEEDWTEDGIVSQLLDAGVPSEDIVLGFRHPSMRPYTEFAVA